MSDDPRLLNAEQMEHIAILLSIEPDELEPLHVGELFDHIDAQADEIARLRKQVEAAESIVNQIKAAGVGLRMAGIVNPGEFLIELAESYRATASTEQEADRG